MKRFASGLIVILLPLLFGVVGLASAASAEITAATVVEKTNEAAYYQGTDGRAQVSMVITDAQGRERRRQLTILRRNDAAVDSNTAQVGQRYYVLFHRPADVEKTAFLVWKQPGRDDDRWLYLPALDLVRRIAASDERTSFVGSHFFYEDVSGRGIDEDAHQLVETTANYYVLLNTPKDPSSVEFASFKMWIHRATFLPIKIEYYDAQGETYRVYEALKVETIGRHPTVVEARMRDLRSGGETTLRYSKVDYDLGLPEEIFTERYLRSAPVEHLR